MPRLGGGPSTSLARLFFWNLRCPTRRKDDLLTKRVNNNVERRRLRQKRSEMHL